VGTSQTCAEAEMSGMQPLLRFSGVLLYKAGVAAWAFAASGMPSVCEMTDRAAAQDFPRAQHDPSSRCPRCMLKSLASWSLR
jgi:hypothetical protein